MSDLVLASTSPYRRALLRRLGIPFRCRAPLVDEDALKVGAGTPRATAERLAYAKTMSLIDLEPDAILIGGDQLVDFEGQILGKPSTAEGAIAQLTLMSGRSHRLITAMAVWRAGE